mgnify:CR=1 FL=1
MNKEYDQIIKEWKCAASEGTVVFARKNGEAGAYRRFPVWIRSMYSDP